MLEVSPHFVSEQTMYWSMMICAPLAKSPNCASHKHEHVGEIEPVAVIEAEHGVLGERAVVDAERRLARLDVVERLVALARLHVVEHRVALGERAAAAVLAGETHRVAAFEQAAEGERLGRAPVERRPCPRSCRGGSGASA